MAKKIESYNASYPAAYYEIGTLYAFYAQGNISGTPASEKYVQRFSSVLKSLEEHKSSKAIQPVKGDLSNEPPLRIGILTRYYAVVVDKNPTNIEVMFLNKDGSKESFLTKKYIVNGSATMDGKDLMTPATHTNVSEIKGKENVIGGITKTVVANGKVGGITKIGNESSQNAGIGRITKVNKNESVNHGTSGIVGGITKMNKSVSVSPAKVGGITRIRN